MSDLKVNEVKTEIIKNQAGTTAATIDASGRFLKSTSTQVAFSVWPSGGGNISSGTTLPWNNADLNLGSAFDTSTYKFTAPVAGVYFFSAYFLVGPGNLVIQMLHTPSGGSEAVVAIVHVNNDDASINWRNPNIVNLIQLGAGDTIHLKHNSGTSTIYFNGSGTDDYNRFVGYLIG